MNYQIITDSACDLPQQMLQELDIVAVPLIVNFRGEARNDSVADDQVKELYDAMRAGEVASTSAVNPDGWTKAIAPALAAGKDLPKEFFVEPSKNSDPTAVLSKGIKNACLGIGLAIMIWFMTEEMGIASIGILIFFIGIGQVITAYATREKEESKNEPSNCTDIEQL